MLQNQDDLLSTIRAIHAAAVDPDVEAWPAILARLGDALSGSGAVIVDHRLPESIADITSAHLPREVPAHISAKVDERYVRALLLAPVNTPLALDAVVDEAEFRRSETYTEVLWPAGLRHVVAAVLERSPTNAVTMGLLRGGQRGHYDHDELSFLGHLLPHLAAAALVRRRLAVATAAVEASRSVLRLLDRSVILVDRTARVVWANPGAEGQLARKGGVISVDRGGALIAARPGETARLRRLVVAAAAAGAGENLAAGGVLSLPRPDGRPCIVQVLPLAPETHLVELAHLPVRPEAALLLSDPDDVPALPQAKLRQAYGLTGAEAALVARLLDGLDLRESADAMGVTQNTAKTQLKAAFAKIGVERQAALVRQVMIDLGGVRNGTAESSRPAGRLAPLSGP